MNAPSLPMVLAKPIRLTVNGDAVDAVVEPRTSLADFLREQQRLTGTHLGCEHGICGACTVLLDGAPARSCITYAIQCDGAEVRSIEGFDNDPLMGRLRDAFSREHALQCGFCTPGMLISSWDVCSRVQTADELRIREELSGNLCRCTGYMGIVAAVKRVIAETETGARGAGEKTAAVPVCRASAPAPVQSFTTLDHAAPPGATGVTQEVGAGTREGWTRIQDGFTVDHPVDRVWQVFGDMPMVTRCLPGAELLEHTDRSIKGQIRISFGPIKAGFAGSATLERDEANKRGVIRGAGRDSLSGSRAKGDIGYTLSPSGNGTRVGVDLEFMLQGPLAQFSRGGLVRDFASRLIAEFARNLSAQLAAGTQGGSAAGPPAALASGRAAPATPTARLDAGAIFGRWVTSMFRALFGR